MWNIYVKKIQFPCFQFHKVLQNHESGEVEKYCIFIAYFLSNISANHYENPTMLLRVIAKNVGDVFWDTVYIQRDGHTKHMVVELAQQITNRLIRGMMEKNYRAVNPAARVGRYTRTISANTEKHIFLTMTAAAPSDNIFGALCIAIIIMGVLPPMGVLPHLPLQIGLLTYLPTYLI